jgi:hypothetical protein
MATVTVAPPSSAIEMESASSAEIVPPSSW